MFILPFTTSFSKNPENTSAFKLKDKKHNGMIFKNNFIINPFIVILQNYTIIKLEKE